MNRRGVCMVPDLPVKEIIAYFAEMDVSITAAELLKPGAASAQRIYENALDVFVGPVQPVADESLQAIRLVQRMGIFLERIGMPGFTVRDLAPESKRLISILSNIINFGMYRDNKRHVYEKVAQIADTNYSNRKACEAKIEYLHEETRKMAAELERNAQAASAISSEVQALEDELKNLYRIQKDKAGEVSLLKNEKTELGDRLSAAQLLEQNLKQEVACLRAQIVSDPTRLMELVEEMRQLAEKEKESIRVATESISTGESRLLRTKRCTELLKSAANIGRGISSVNSKIEELDQQSAGAEGRLKAWDSRINALKIRTNHVDRQISHLQSKIFNLQGKDKRSSEELSEKISNLRIKYDAVSDERNQMLTKVQENNRKVQDLMFQRSKISNEHEQQCSEIVSLLVRINSQIDAYFSSMAGCIE